MPRSFRRSILALSCLAAATAIVPDARADEPLFPAPVPTTGDEPEFIAIGDLNADLVADLVVVNNRSYTISVMLGRGDGTFQASQDFATGIAPQSVAISDFDGNGKPDFAVASAGSDSVSVLLGNGDATFQIRRDFATDELPWAVAIGDLDGNGTPDLAVANHFPSDTVTVLLNESEVPCPADVTGDGEISAADLNLVLANFGLSTPDGDGVVDLADLNAVLGAFGTACP